MLFSELKEKIGNGFFDVGELEVKKYLPLLTKGYAVKQACEDILSYDDNGLAYVPQYQKRISRCIAMLLYYTNLEIPEDMMMDEVVDVIDLLMERGLYKQILDEIGDDYCDFYWMLDDELDSIISRNNSIEAVVAKGINKLIEKVPTDKQIKSIIKAVKSNPKAYADTGVNYIVTDGNSQISTVQWSY